MLEQQVSVKKIASQRLLASHTGPTGAPYLLQASFLEWQQFQKCPDFVTQNCDFFLFLDSELKIPEKVAFNIAIEASYIYILSGQKFIKNAKNSQFCEFFQTRNL